jgi:hypothetical protein
MESLYNVKEIQNIVFGCPYPYAVAVIGVIAFVVVAIFAWRDTARLKGLGRVSILGLGLFGALMLLAMLLDPRIVRRWEDPYKPNCAILTDTSRSMLLEDTYKNNAAKWVIGKLAPNASGQNELTVSREKIIQAILSNPDTGIAKPISERFQLSGWQFAKDVESLALDKDADVVAVNPEGYASAIGDALHEISGATGSDRPNMIVLIGDGAWNTGRDPSEVGRMLGRVGTRVYTVGIGDPEPPRDVSVVKLNVPSRTILGEELVIEVEIMAPGAMRVPVQLSIDGEEIDTKYVSGGPAGQTRKVRFSQVPEEPGFRGIKVSIERQKGEANVDNNIIEQQIEVVEQKIRVLMVESIPRWEFRFVRSVLERDPAIEVETCLLRPGIGPIKGPTYVGDLPRDRKGLAGYDVIILGDVTRRDAPASFEAFTKEVSAMVRGRGASLVIMAGKRNGYRELAGTDIAKILPVRLDGAAPGSRVVGRYSLELTPEGQDTLYMRLDESRDLNAAIWARLPEMRWSADVASLAPGARPLLVHPRRFAGTEKLPLVAYQRIGSGKVMFFGIQETWRWRKAVGDRWHYRFWAQAVRWLAKKQFAEGDSRARLSIARVDSNVGEPVEVEAFCLDNDGYPDEDAEVRVQITHSDGEKEIIALEASPDGWGMYRGIVTPKREGDYTLEPIVASHGPDPLPSTASLHVTRLDLEKHALAQNRAALMAIAEASGGAYIPLEEVDGLPELLKSQIKTRILTKEYKPCRDSWFYALMAVVLAAAWFIRKRSGLA